MSAGVCARCNDGVRARLIASGDGQLASWIVCRKSADTKVGPIALKQGIEDALRQLAVAEVGRLRWPPIIARSSARVRVGWAA